MQMQEPPSAPGDESKRSFLKLVLSSGLVALAGAILYPILAYLRPPKQGEVEVSSVKAEAPSEGAAPKVTWSSVPSKSRP